jgi:hypothetical protein
MLPIHSTNVNQIIAGVLTLKAFFSLKSIERCTRLFFAYKTSFSRMYWDSRLKCNEYRENFRSRSENSSILRNRGHRAARKSSRKGSRSGGPAKI